MPLNLLSKKTSSTPQIGGKYQELVDNNPYRNREYRESPWQFFLSNLGFRTQADAWRENMATQAAEYDAAILQKKYDEEYNSPEQQAARMRAAGLNPDINGGDSIDSGQAVGLPEDPSTPMQSTGWDGTAESLGSSILGAFSTALGIVSSIQGVNARSIQNGKDIVSFARDQFPNLIPSFGETQDYTFGDVRNNGLQMAKIFSDQNVPKRYRRKFMNAIEGFWSSAPGTREAYEEWSKRVSSKRDYAVNSQTMFDEFSDVLYPISKEIADMNEQIFKQNQRTDLAESKASEATSQTEEAYQKELDGSLMGAAQNAANKAAESSSESIGIVTSHIKNIMDNLEQGAKEGGLKGSLCSIALSIVSGMYLYVQSGMHPHVNSSSSSSVREGRSSYGTSESRGFSIGF